MADQHRLNLNEAAELADCSRKTLYRYMAKGPLAYRKAANNRRYVRRQDIETLFPKHQHRLNKSRSLLADLGSVVSVLETLTAGIKKQQALIERMIALYQPKSFAELANKHKK